MCVYIHTYVQIYIFCVLFAYSTDLYTYLPSYLRTYRHTHIYIYIHIYTYIYICDKKDQRDFFRNETRSRGLLKQGVKRLCLQNEKNQGAFVQTSQDQEGFLKEEMGFLLKTFRYYCWLIQKQRCKLWCEAGF